MKALEIEKAIKLFGVSNQLVETNLTIVEESLSLDLGRIKINREEKDSRYYPQFDEKVRNEAAKMAEHYEIFYCLERSIRKLISETLETVEPKVWWNDRRIPPGIFAETEKRIARERDFGITVRSDNPLDYTNFGELGEIIKHNWDVFGSLFSSLKAVERVMVNLNLLRAPIAHCTPLAEDEVLRLRLSVKDWFRLME